MWPAIIHFLLMTSLDTTSQDHTTENWVRMGVAGLVLLALLAILAENRLGPQLPHQEDQQDLPDLSWSWQRSQTERTFGLTPKDHQGDSWSWCFLKEPASAESYAAAWRAQGRRRYEEAWIPFQTNQMVFSYMHLIYLHSTFLDIVENILSIILAELISCDKK